MIDEALVFIKNNLNQYIHLQLFSGADEVVENHVVFLEGNSLESISFSSGFVSLLLVNIEEEKTLRSANLYSRATPNGSSVTTRPEIKLNLYILFVARFEQYETSLKYISLILKYFQSNRSFSANQDANLSADIGKLNIELITQQGNELNEMWGTLKIGYQPSLLYKLSLLVFMDGSIEPKSEVQNMALDLKDSV